MRRIRLVDLGTMPAARAHVLLDALSTGVSAGQPDTLALVAPAERYLSIGVYQELSRDVDAAFCEAHGTPIFRRHIGGGALVLDGDQMIVAPVFHRRTAAISATRMYQSLLTVIVETYRACGVDAHYLPIDRIDVRNAQISGSAIGRLNNAIAFLSTFAFSCDDEFARNAIRMPDTPSFTSMARELGRTPDRDRVRDYLVAAFERQFEATVVPGGLSEREFGEIERLEGEIDHAEWRSQVDSRVGALRSGAGSNATIREGIHDAEGGTIRATIRVIDERIDDIVLSGDFAFYEDHLYGLEGVFRGVGIDWDDLMTVVENYYLSYAVDSPGTNPDDWVTAIAGAKVRD